MAGRRKTLLTPELRASSDEDVLDLIEQLCRERPALQERLVDVLTQASARYVGLIKKFDPSKRFGFIECEETHALYERDVFLSDQQINGFENGSLVSFALSVNAQGKPQAQDLEDATPSSAVVVPTRPISVLAEQPRIPRAYAEPADSFPREVPRAYMEPAASYPQEELPRFVGTIKRFDREKRFGFIDCEETMAQFGRDVFLSDKCIGPFDNGSLVSFLLSVNAQGQPQAQELDHATPSPAPPAYPAWTPREAHVEQPRSRAIGERFESPEEGMGRFLGVIKRFDHEKRFGFIDCPDLKAQYGKDVFLSDKQIGTFDNDARVSFVLTLNPQGQPQAQQLMPAEPERSRLTPRPPPAPPAPPAPPRGRSRSPLQREVQPAKRRKIMGELDSEVQPPKRRTDESQSGVSDERYIGTIKKFDPVKHFGFIECPEVHEIFGLDVFLSDKQIGDFTVGSQVSFTYVVKSGKPQACNLEEP